MQENEFDDVLNGVVVKIGEVAEELSTQFKNVKPAFKKEITDRDLIKAFDNNTLSDFMYLSEKHGPEKMQQYIAYIQNLKMGRQ